MTRTVVRLLRRRNCMLRLTTIGSIFLLVITVHVSGDSPSLVLADSEALLSPTGRIASSNHETSDATGSGGCRLPVRMQGEYRRQQAGYEPPRLESGVRYAMKYTDYYIGPSSVSHWGDCYLNTGNERNKYILGITKVGGYKCYRCFTLIQRSPNVVQVLTSGEEYCYRSINAASRTCRVPDGRLPGEGIILWRNVNELDYESCPLSGKLYLSYQTADGLLTCDYPQNTAAAVRSELSNCDRSYQLDAKFRSCSFKDSDLSLKCLGSWDTGFETGERFFGVYNAYTEEYRCGIYKSYDDGSPVYATAALSNDSTCLNQLINSTHGSEMFTFTKARPPSWPELERKCVFPAELQGEFGGVLAVRGDVMTYFSQPIQQNDNTLLQSSTAVHAKCVQVDDHSLTVYSRTHCGDPIGYHCIRYERRSAAVFELKIGAVVLGADDEKLCTKAAIYRNSSWVTVAAETPVKAGRVVACAHAGGEYATPPQMRRAGADCFNVSVDCARTHHMHITAYKCDSGALFDSRRYHCLGSWQEDSFFYSYVIRYSDYTTGCFVSQIRNGLLYLSWTGSQCVRNVDLQKLTEESQVFVLQETDNCRPKVSSTLPPYRQTTPIKTIKVSDTDWDTSVTVRRHPGSKRGKNSASRLLVYSPIQIPHLSAIVSLCTSLYFCRRL